jgi:hypothetical protein
MEYQNSKHVRGEANATAKKLVDSLVSQGFRIAVQQRDSVELLGPGMHSSRQNPLVGASKVAVRSWGREVAIEADFGAVRRMIRALGVFFIGMTIFLFVLFGFVIPSENMVVRFVVPLLPLAPWPVLLPWMGWLFRRRAARAFDALLQNVAG